MFELRNTEICLIKDRKASAKDSPFEKLAEGSLIVLGFTAVVGLCHEGADNFLKQHFLVDVNGLLKRR